MVSVGDDVAAVVAASVVVGVAIVVDDNDVAVAFSEDRQPSTNHRAVRVLGWTGCAESTIQR